MLRNLIVVLFVLSITYASSIPGTSDQHSYLNGASRDYKTIKTGTDKQQYGVEVEANHQFHHTSTEEDGVRLGCYGHVQDGKKYATRYVADAHGYRVVQYSDFITVYPKSGEESRNASFSRDLRPDQGMSEYVHFYFPEECEKHHTEVVSASRAALTIAVPPSIVRTSTDASFGSLELGSSIPEDDSTVTPSQDENSTPSQDENSVDQCEVREPKCECTCTY